MEQQGSTAGSPGEALAIVTSQAEAAALLPLRNTLRSHLPQGAGSNPSVPMLSVPTTMAWWEAQGAHFLLPTALPKPCRCCLASPSPWWQNLGTGELYSSSSIHSPSPILGVKESHGSIAGQRPSSGSAVLTAHTRCPWLLASGSYVFMGAQ